MHPRTVNLLCVVLPVCPCIPCWFKLFSPPASCQSNEGVIHLYHSFHSWKPLPHTDNIRQDNTTPHCSSTFCVCFPISESTKHCPAHSLSCHPCRTWPTLWLYRAETRNCRRYVREATKPRAPENQSTPLYSTRWSVCAPSPPLSTVCVRSSPSTRGRSPGCHEHWQNMSRAGAGGILRVRGGDRRESEQWKRWKGIQNEVKIRGKE